MAEYVRLYLVRHGHVQYFDDQHRPINPKYAPLSAQGVHQIQLLAHVLRDLKIDQIYSSTMPRSIQTAQILAEKQSNQTIISLDGIREIKAGRLKDIVPEQAEHIIAKAYHYQQYELSSFLNGESWQDFRDRVLPCLKRMIHNHQNQHILIAAHDAVNRLILAWAHHQIEQDLHAFEQHYGCLNIIDVLIEHGEIVEKRILLQNYTVDNPLKIDQRTNAVEDVYQMYIKTNGFQEKLT